MPNLSMKLPISATFIALLLLSSLITNVRADDPYEYRPASRDGIGKFYMGREISHVMGHQAAPWLERNDRKKSERTDLVIKYLPIEADFTVADIGAGTGYFSFPVALRVPDGHVFAVDIQQEMLDIIEARKSADTQNITTVLGGITSPNLPENSIDLAFIVDAYHEFSHPFEMGQGLFRALKPGGQLVLIEYRGEDPWVPIKPLHKMTQAQAKKEMLALGFVWQTTKCFLPQQHFMVFTKPL